jgi:hypothetical protein
VGESGFTNARSMAQSVMPITAVSVEIHTRVEAVLSPPQTEGVSEQPIPLGTGNGIGRRFFVENRLRDLIGEARLREFVERRHDDVDLIRRRRAAEVTMR